MDIQPIETVYNGYRFRSRLEARWAVFFDALNIKYEYEPEGFELTDDTRYLPDFYLPDETTYVEIKPTYSGDEPRRKLSQLLRGKIANAILIEGTPSVAENEIHDTYGVQWVTKAREYNVTYFVGSTRNVFYPWAEHYLTEVFYSLQEMLEAKGYKPPVFDGGIRSAYELIEADKKYFLEKYGKPHHKWTYGLSFENLCFEDLLPASRFFTLRLELNNLKADEQASTIDSPRLIEAMLKARQARFEHGERG